MAPLPAPRLGPSAARLRGLTPLALAMLVAPFFTAVLPHGILFRCRLFDPLTTLWLMVLRSLTPKGSCREATIALCALGREASPRSGAFCRARARLPLEWLEALAAVAASGAEKRLSAAHRLWHGFSVKVVDGTTVRLPDTAANQALWPQPDGQKKGCGFPVLRLTGVFSLATGAILGRATGSLQDGESTLFLTQLLSSFGKGDLGLLDRGFSGYGVIAGLFNRGAQVAARLHQRLSVSLVEVRRHGPGDRVMRWPKPRRPNAGFDEGQWAALPESLTVRLVTVHVLVPGFRTRRYTVLTTLTDAARFPASELAELYRRRWQVELFFRHIKTTMGFEELVGRSPAMALRDLAAALLAYNLVRGVMVLAAGACDPARLSFAAAAQALRRFSAAARAGTRSTLRRLLETVAACLLPARPDRSEPRAVKRRPKNYQRLTGPRGQMHAPAHRSRHQAPRPQPEKNRRQTNPSLHEEPAVIVTARA